MHTFAQQTPVAGVIEYTGTLLHRAEARTAQIDAAGHYAPVLCLDIELDNDMRTRLHAEQPFPVGHYTQAAAAAHRLTKGTRVTVQAPMVSLRLVANSATHIHVHPQPQEQTSNGPNHHDTH